jgi:hypothetical protein
MHTVSLLTTAALMVAPASGADLRTAPKDKKIDNAYIVRLLDSIDRQTLETHISKMHSNFNIKDFQVKNVYGSLADKHRASYSVHLSPLGLEGLLKHEDVQYVEEDEVVSLSDCRSQTNEDWGTARINHRNYNMSKTYSYDYTTGEALDVVILRACAVFYFLLLVS